MTTTIKPGAEAKAPVPGASPDPALRRLVARRLRRTRDEIVSRWYNAQFAPERMERWHIAGLETLSRADIVSGFVGPLFELLVLYLEGGDELIRAVYLDERLRYAPHQARPEDRVRFFRELLPLDEAAVDAALVLDRDLQDAFHQASASIHAPLLEVPKGATIRLLALGDCIFGDLRVFLPDACRALGFGLDMRCMYFSGLVGKDLSTSEVRHFFAANPTDVVALSFLTYEGIPPYAQLLREAGGLGDEELQRRVDALVGHMRRFVADLREASDAPFLIHNASGLPLTRARKHVPLLPPLSRGVARTVTSLNQAIAELVENTPNCVLIDEDAVVRGGGYRHAGQGIVPRRIAQRAFLHTARLGGLLAPVYAGILQAFETMRKAKVLLLDFDNTLWDGVMAEGDVRQHHDRQALLRRLREAGMLLVAVSKNETASIRWNEMSLTQDDFVLQKINWNTKVQSIREVAQQLDLGFDSLVLLDDNPVERELVTSQLPMVRVLDSDDARTWRAVELLLRFPNTKGTDEARRRTEIYREQALRREALASEVDYPAMMAGLRLQAKFGPAHEQDIDRVAELVQRTNQFNTTTIRYSKQQLQRMAADPAHRVFVAQLDDKFGSIGLVVVAVVAIRGTDAVFESFLMSCRAMGFRLEHLVARLIMDALPDARRFVGRFSPTDRNTPAAGLWRECGFAQATEGGDWVLEDRSLAPAIPAWFRVVPR